MSVPACRFYFDVLTYYVVAEVLRLLQVINQCFVCRCGIQTVRPPPLVERTELEIVFVVQLQASDAILTFADRHIRPYDGGFVKEPQKGLHESVVSFDANSLYPNTIITLNISPETKIGKIVRKSEDNIEIMLSNGKVHPLTIPQFKQFIQQQEVAISKAGVLFSQKNKGFCPELVDIIYEDRVKDRKRLKELKLKRSKLEKELKSLIENDDQKSI